MKATTIKISILLILWATIFYPVYPVLIKAWFGGLNSDNSYGILVPFISLYFIWIRRESLNLVQVATYPMGSVLLIASLSLYLLGYIGGVALLQRTMMVLSLSGLVLYIFGKETYKVLSFSLLFLLFMIPVPDSVRNMVTFPLQTYATIIAENIIHFFSIPVYREGHMLYFAQTQLEVAEACSGIHSMTALLILSVVFTNLCNNSRILKTIVIISSIPIAFVANVFRVSGTGILAHFFGAGVAQGFLHEFSGMTVFAFGFLLMFFEYKLLNRIFSGK
jgi:exosortase